MRSYFRNVVKNYRFKAVKLIKNKLGWYHGLIVPSDRLGIFLNKGGKMTIEKKNPIIFIVSGKANSGKDTSCELINNYVKLKGHKSVNLQFSSYIKMYAKVISGWDGNEDTKPRSLLQELGTNIIRNKIDNEFFIKRIIGDIKVYSYY